ncbi:DUF481 domain-containing protein [Tabrizicola sp. BL-A-41-H6]|uniref:DUF481 domain-containing protein n=1 Tax=Tabrizicola sp. BL-A-41-H6 TaxID=3421107 RepID=UPI003D66643D
MKHVTLLASVSAFGLMLAGAAAAQTELTGIDTLNDRLDDIEENVQDDFDRSEDESRFGNPEFRPGLSGSASLAYSGQTGNNESQDLTIGARLRYAQGNFVQSIGTAIEFSDDEGTSTTEDLFAVYDANLYFNDSFYGFVLGRIEMDGLAEEGGLDDADPLTGPEDFVRRDAFLGVGPGYRVFNTDQMTWRVQAGVGVSYLQYGDLMSETEIGYIASSRFYYAFNENIFMTNDTDILKSDSALRVNNDLGVSFKMTDAFSTRVSYLTEYNDSRDIETDSKLGVALVYGF